VGVVASIITASHEELWRIAELLRIKGELVLVQGAPEAAAAAADHHFHALDWARRQGALSWELRAATSLARLLRDQGRSADATARHCQVEALQRRLGATKLGLMPRWSRCAIALRLLIGICEASTGRQDGAGG
jgi:predicted ATPase